jgi:hypothetical protein
MDERYLRFPRWIEFSGLPEKLSRETGPECWLLFRRMLEQDIIENLFPDWVDLDAGKMAVWTGLAAEKVLDLFKLLCGQNLFRARNLGDAVPYYQYRIVQPLPVPLDRELILESLRKAHLPDRPEVWRYWEDAEGETKYERILRLYETTCGLKISGRIVEDLVELAETHPLAHLEEAFEAARDEGVTTLGWIKKFLKRLRKHDRVQKAWGRPGGLELPEGYTVPSEEEPGDNSGGG